MKYIAIISSFMLFSSSVGAGPFVEIGQSHYQKPINGLWWQDQYPATFNLDGKYFRLGYEIGSWRVSYFNLGKYRTQALATVEEIKYFAGECNAKTCKAPDYYQTDGSVQGILFSGVSRGTFGYVEAGVSYSRQTFELNALGLRPGSNFLYSPGPASEYGHYLFEDTQYGLGYMIGLGLEYKRFTLSLNYFKQGKVSSFYDHRAGMPTRFPGIYAAAVLAVGYRF